MGGFRQPNNFVKKTWDRSYYKPKTMTSKVLDVTDEVNKTCSNMRELQSALYTLAAATNSSSYSSHVRTLTSNIGSQNSRLSTTSIDAINNLLVVCNAISAHNQSLASSMEEIAKVMDDAQSIVEKYVKDGSEE